MRNPFEELAIPAEYSYFAEDTGRIHLQGAPVSQLHRFLKSRFVENAPVLIHELVHSYCEGTALGLACFLTQFRYARDAAKIHNPPSDIRRRFHFVDRIVKPVQEGLALFAQFDYRPNVLDWGAECFLDAFYYFLAGYFHSGQAASKKRREKNFVLDFVLRSSLTSSAVDDKLNLLLSDLQRPLPHFLGYIWMKQLYLRIARSGVKPFFVMFLLDFMLNDFALAALVLNTRISDVEFESTFVSKLREKLLWLEHGNLPAAVLMLKHEPECRDRALRRKADDRELFHSAVDRFYKTQIPEVGLPSRIDQDVTSVSAVLNFAMARRRVHRMLSTSVFVEKSSARKEYFDLYAARPIGPSALLKGPKILSLPRYAPNTALPKTGYGTVFLLAVFHTDRPAVEVYLAASGLSQLLSLIHLGPGDKLIAEDAQIISYLQKSDKIDEFLTYLQRPVDNTEVAATTKKIDQPSANLWTQQRSTGVLQRFFPGGTPKGHYSTLKDALGSGQALRDYAELSLVAALMDRYFTSREHLRKVLGSINGLAQRTDVSLKRFRDLVDWAGDHSRSSDFWFSTLL